MEAIPVLTGPKIIAVHKLKNAGMSIGREALLSDIIATTACWKSPYQLKRHRSRSHR